MDQKADAISEQFFRTGASKEWALQTKEIELLTITLAYTW
jgi:hypothetical protein